MMKAVTVVGSGPNGLAAAITLARAGLRVRVIEAAATIGGGLRTAALTLPGFRHDICAAVLPLAEDSAFFRAVPLADHGVEWIRSPAVLAHPLDDDEPVLLHRSLSSTAQGLGPDAGAYERLMSPILAGWERLDQSIMGPLWPLRHPVSLARFGLVGLQSASRLARARFRGERARALFAGISAHSMLPLDSAGSASFGLVLAALGHRVDWPIPRGGSQRVADALASVLRSHGGEVEVGREVCELSELLESDFVLLDVTPKQFARIAGDRLPAAYRRELSHYRYGMGVFKVDYALDGPIPWARPECGHAITVHVGGTLPEIEASEAEVAAGRIPDRPFVLLAQPSLFDETRAPAGQHTAWAYCHVPLASGVDMRPRIEAQIERFAPGFRERVVACHAAGPAQLEAYNPNYVGGNINGGAQDLRQTLVRPAWRLDPYSTPVPGVFLCSASTPPGGGVHGMCGHHAALSVLRSAGVAISRDRKVS